MIHVLDRLRHITQPVCVVGKGPSFDARAVAAAREAGAFIVSINDTYFAGDFPADLVVMNDWWVIEKLDRHSQVRLVAVASMPHPNTPPHLGTLDYYQRIVPMFHRLGAKLCYFDLYQQKYFVEHPSIEANGSSVESAVHILALAGASDFRFVGVDCSEEYHPRFGKRLWPGSLAGVAAHLERFRRQFGLTYAGLGGTA